MDAPCQPEKKRPQPKTEADNEKSKQQCLYKTLYRWWKPLDLDEFASSFREVFEISFRPDLVAEEKIDIFSRDRREMRVCADTVSALLSPYRAVLYQREPSKLTERDRRLLEVIREAYPRGRYTPFL